MKERFGCIAIKGFPKETDLCVILDILKKAGLPFDSKKEDLGTSKRNGANDIWIYDLKQETRYKIFHNLDGEEKFGKKISVRCFISTEYLDEDTTDSKAVFKDASNAGPMEISSVLTNSSSSTIVNVAPSPNLMSCSHKTNSCPCSKTEKEEMNLKGINDNIVPMTSEDSDSENTIEEESSTKSKSQEHTMSFDYSPKESSNGFSLFQNLVKFWHNTSSDISLETTEVSEATAREEAAFDENFNIL